MKIRIIWHLNGEWGHGRWVKSKDEKKLLELMEGTCDQLNRKHGEGTHTLEVSY